MCVPGYLIIVIVALSLLTQPGRAANRVSTSRACLCLKVRVKDGSFTGGWVNRETLTCRDYSNFPRSLHSRRDAHIYDTSLARRFRGFAARLCGWTVPALRARLCNKHDVGNDQHFLRGSAKFSLKTTMLQGATWPADLMPISLGCIINNSVFQNTWLSRNKLHLERYL